MIYCWHNSDEMQRCVAFRTCCRMSISDGSRREVCELIHVNGTRHGSLVSNTHNISFFAPAGLFRASFSIRRVEERRRRVARCYVFHREKRKLRVEVSLSDRREKRYFDLCDGHREMNLVIIDSIRFVGFPFAVDLLPLPLLSSRRRRPFVAVVDDEQTAVHHHLV